MKNEQIITQHIQSLEIQNRGYRKQLEAEISDLLCRGLTRSVKENNVIIGVLKQAFHDNEASDLAKVAHWAFRHGWRERAGLVGVNKQALDRRFLEALRIMLSNKLYEKSFDNKYLGIVYDNIKNK